MQRFDAAAAGVRDTTACCSSWQGGHMSRHMRSDEVAAIMGSQGWDQGQRPQRRHSSYGVYEAGGIRGTPWQHPLGFPLAANNSMQVGHAPAHSPFCMRTVHMHVGVHGLRFAWTHAGVWRLTSTCMQSPSPSLPP